MDDPVTPQAMVTSELKEWAAHDVMRDSLVRRAIAAGLTKQQVHRLSGIARSTIDRILSNG